MITVAAVSVHGQALCTENILSLNKIVTHFNSELIVIKLQFKRSADSCGFSFKLPFHLNAHCSPYICLNQLATGIFCRAVCGLTGGALEQKIFQAI